MGTPDVQHEMRFRSIPEELALWEFTKRFITDGSLSNEAWLDVLEKYRLYLVRLIFPKITLHTFQEEEWVKLINPKKGGELRLFGEQGALISIQSSKTVLIWGLTRRGEWVRGHAVMENREMSELDLFPSTAEELMRELKLTPAEIVSNLSDFIEGQMEERYRVYKELEVILKTGLTFKDILSIKPQPTF